MHPTVVAFNTQLPLNGARIDVYIRTATTPGFNISTGIKTSTKTKYSNIQAIECPIDNQMFRAPNAQNMTKQSFATVLMVRIHDIPSQTIKLNDYIFLNNQQYLVSEVSTIAGLIYLLGLNHWTGDKREISWEIYIKDVVTLEDSVVQVP